MEFIEIGIIVNTHGLKGTVKVKSFTDFAMERFQKDQTLYIHYKNEYISVKVMKMKPVKNLLYVDFEGLNNINLVEKYKQSKLYINASDVHDLEEDDFYVRELIGMEVYTETLVGEVIDVYDMPKDDILVVKRKNAKNVLIPFRNQFIKEVNTKEKTIYLIDWEGLL